MERKSKKEGIYIYIHIYIADSLCCMAETNMTLYSNYDPIKILKIIII